ncbi:NUDIX domain-containing protein [Lysobacter sp. Hz 25]|uniref:NUDIX domain-containing protein n=1 Tax=Lysobacter sp. Hz 25 TaxID=3383698 RepID=UPI0038D35943
MNLLDASFPKKRISAGGLIRNGSGEILIVKPAYRAGWLLPGGIVEHDESPMQALYREIQEEVALRVRPQRLLCVDYLSAGPDFSESVHLLFECAPLDEEAVGAIRIDRVELIEFRFCSLDEAESLLVPSIAKRLRALSRSALIPAYLENGGPLV